MINLHNRYGKIGLDNAVYARIAIETARQFDGRIEFTNQRGKPVKVGTTGKESLSFIDIISDGENVDLKVYVIVRFGTSLKRISRDYGKALRENAENITGRSVRNITMVVTGVRSENVSKRDLEFKC